MPVYTTTSGVNALLPDSYGPLVVQPALDMSVFAQVATIATTSSTEYRIPIVSADPTAAWVAEGAEITPSDPTLQELTVTPAKVAGLTIISRELANDSNPAAAQVVGDGLARDIARRIDQAAFAGLASPAPAGLSTLSGVQTYVSASAFANLDFAAEAISKAETVGATITAFVTSPATALALAKVRTDRQQRTPPRQGRHQRHRADNPRRSAVRVTVRRSEHPLGHRQVPGLAGRPRGHHRRSRQIGVLHQRPGRGQGRHAGRVRVRPRAVRRQDLDRLMGKRITITEGYAVYVNGDQVPGGATVAVDQDTAEHWIARGWAVEAKAATKPQAKAPAKAAAKAPAGTRAPSAKAAKPRARKP